MLSFLRKLMRRRSKKSRDSQPEQDNEDNNAMENQKLTAITRGLQNAAAETNSMVAEQYIRILSQYFDHDPDGTLRAKMVKVQLDENHVAMVPLVSMAAPSGLALDRMRVELSIRLEGADIEGEKNLLSRLKNNLKRDTETSETSGDRANFSVSLSPRSERKSEGRPSDHVHIDLEFKSIETPESVLRVIETYTNMIQPIKSIESETPPSDAPISPAASQNQPQNGQPPAPPPIPAIE